MAMRAAGRPCGSTYPNDSEPISARPVRSARSHAVPRKAAEIGRARQEVDVVASRRLACAAVRSAASTVATRVPGTVPAQQEALGDQLAVGVDDEAP